MLLNRKAHFDPLCLVGTLLVIILGGVVAFFARVGKVPQPLVVLFVVILLGSTLLHFFHHGFTPISGIISLIIIIISIVLLRGFYGHGGVFIEYYYANMFYLTIGLISLDIVKTASP